MEILGFLRKKPKVLSEVNKRLESVTAPQKPNIPSEKPGTQTVVSAETSELPIIPDEQTRIQIAKDHASIIQNTVKPKPVSGTK
jgi:hypothetical protein